MLSHSAERKGVFSNLLKSNYNYYSPYLVCNDGIYNIQKSSTVDLSYFHWERLWRYNGVKHFWFQLTIKGNIQ